MILFTIIAVVTFKLVMNYFRKETIKFNNGIKDDAVYFNSIGAYVVPDGTLDSAGGACATSTAVYIELKYTNSPEVIEHEKCHLRENHVGIRQMSESITTAILTASTLTVGFYAGLIQGALVFAILLMASYAVTYLVMYVTERRADEVGVRISGEKDALEEILIDSIKSCEFAAGNGEKLPLATKMSLRIAKARLAKIKALDTLQSAT